MKRLLIVILLVAAIFVLGLVIAGGAVWILKSIPPPDPVQVHRYDYLLPEDQGFTGGQYGRRLTISPDGTKIVYVANEQLYLKNSNELTAGPIRGSNEDPMDPFFSPNGQWVGYFSQSGNQFKKISINGGSSVKLWEGENLSTPSWTADDMILFGGIGRITLVSPSKGTAEEILKGEEDEWLSWPQILPGGKSILYSVYSVEDEEFKFAVQSLDAEKSKLLFPGGPAQYLPTGHIIYAVENTLRAIRFDPDTLETIGDEVPLIEGVFRFGTDRPTQVAISDSGTMAYMPGGMGRIFQGTLAWVNREGREEPIDEKPRLYSNVNISPDGTRVAFQITVDGNADIWIYDLARKTLTQLTRHEADDGSPIWTPDGKQIIFCSEREGNLSIFSIAASGTGQAEQIAYIEDSYIWPFSLSNDGKILSFGHWNLLDGYNIGIHSMDGAHAPKLLLQDEYIKSYPRISPDGRWLAYQTNKTGQDEVYIHSFPDVDSGRKEQVSIGGGRYPVWSPDGKELFYVSFFDKQMVVSVGADPELKIGEPQILFDRRQYSGLDIDPKGWRFLAIKRVESTEDGSAQGIPRKIIVVTNWFEELKKLAPLD